MTFTITEAKKMFSSFIFRDECDSCGEHISEFITPPEITWPWHDYNHWCRHCFEAEALSMFENLQKTILELDEKGSEVLFENFLTHWDQRLGRSLTK